MSKHDLKVGQMLWLVGSHHGRPKEYCGEEIEIVKVGRDWAYFGPSGQSRLRLESLRLDGGGYNSPGRAYLSREACEVERDTDKAWEKMSVAVHGRYGRPDGVTLADVEQAMKLLRLLPSA